MTKIIERIKEAYRLETDAEVADFLGIKPSTLSMQKNRGRLNLQRIIEKCDDLNKNWLLDGEGEMRKDPPQSRHIPIYSSLTIANHGPDLHKSIKAGILFADVTEELQHFSSSDQVIGYVISGNSMEPTLKKNDIAIINLESTPEDDAIFLILSENKAFLRRLREKNGSYLLKKDNGQELVELRKNQKDLNMIGKLVWIMRRV